MRLNVKYRSWSCQNSQKLQNNASSHYPTTIFALCIYFLQYENPTFRIHVFRTRRLIHTPSLSWLQNLNFKFEAWKEERLSLLYQSLVFKNILRHLRMKFSKPVSIFSVLTKKEFNYAQFNINRIKAKVNVRRAYTAISIPLAIQ